MTRTVISEDASRSMAALPGGSNGEFNLTEELTMVIDRGAGCRLWDTAGREFLDFSMGWGSVLVGHAREEVVAAVTKKAPNGSNFSYPTANMLKLAESLIELSPACDKVRFCASGTEATMYCQRLARAFTGRSKILKFEGAYHGANEIGVTSLFPSGSATFPEPEPSSAGIDHIVRDHVLVAPFNDVATTRKIIEEHVNEMAAVIVEPLHRCLPPEEGFLDGLREWTRKHGILLLFDEVVTGFRLAFGGAQEYYGVVPDLVAYGKALGGGYPIGAFGGRTDIMDIVREDKLNDDPRYVWTASTLGGNPISCAAALAAIDIFKRDETYPHLHELGRYFRDQLKKTLNDAGHAAQIIGDGPLAQFIFSDEPVTDYRSTKRGDSGKARRVMLELFRRGVFLNPMGTKLYLSLQHDEAVCDEFCERLGDAVNEVG